MNEQSNGAPRQRRQPVELDLPPLPPLELYYDGQWEEAQWLGTIVLPSWASYCLYFGGGEGASEGGVTEYPLTIWTGETPQVTEVYQGLPPTPEQIAAYTYMVENDKAIQDAVLQVLLDNYPHWRKEYSIREDYMPVVTQPEGFEFLLALSDVWINLAAKDGFAYISLSLQPRWDLEHGLGVTLHKGRVVAMGSHTFAEDAIQLDQEEE